MPDNTPALVVVAAGGLGTRVHDWARFIPKEFYPVDGRPGITRLLEEIAGLGPARVAIVYHPYYEQFAAWGRQVLSHCDHARYARAADLDLPPAVPPRMTISLIPQQGTYGDLTSVCNGADFLAARETMYIAFADNLYPKASPLKQLRDASDADVAVLASVYSRTLALTRGIPITSPGSADDRREVKALVEKPCTAQAIALEKAYGAANLLMLEGRAKVTAAFVHFARERSTEPDGEPKLAAAIGDFARDHQVVAVVANSELSTSAHQQRGCCTRGVEPKTSPVLSARPPGRSALWKASLASADSVQAQDDALPAARAQTPHHRGGREGHVDRSAPADQVSRPPPRRSHALASRQRRHQGGQRDLGSQQVQLHARHVHECHPRGRPGGCRGCRGHSPAVQSNQVMTFYHRPSAPYFLVAGQIELDFSRRSRWSWLTEIISTG